MDLQSHNIEVKIDDVVVIIAEVEDKCVEKKGMKRCWVKIVGDQRWGDVEIGGHGRDEEIYDKEEMISGKESHRRR